jgi:hypothetical protein
MNENLSGQDEYEMFGRRAFTKYERSVRQLLLSTVIRESEIFMLRETIQLLDRLESRDDIKDGRSLNRCAYFSF